MCPSPLKRRSEVLTEHETDHHFAALKARLAAKEARVGIIGLGYVGLPLAVALNRVGFAVTGFDVDPAKAEQLNGGTSYIKHIGDDTVAEMVRSGRFEATGDMARLGAADAILICVPTPLDRHREPDMSFVVTTVRDLSAHLRAGQLVVLESTTYPGTTTEIVKPALEAAGLVSEQDLFIAYSPEREDPGNPQFGTQSIPKVVGGDGKRALALATLLYDQFVVRTVPVSSTETAEAVKLTENIFRAVNVALVNELKLVYGAMGVDIWEVIEAAKTKPFGFMPFYPGPGLGGHCIPIDPFYLTWKARAFDISTRFIELAGEVNRAMPYHVVDRTAATLDARSGRGLHGARILIIGVAYKKNVDDTRESPGLKIIELFEARGATVDYHDPHVPAIRPTRQHGGLTGRCSVPLERETLSGYDAAVVVTDHDGVDWQAVADAVPIVIDTRNALSGVQDHDGRVVKA